MNRDHSDDDLLDPLGSNFKAGYRKKVCKRDRFLIQENWIENPPTTPTKTDLAEAFIEL